MSYIIRTCKECRQKLHIRRKGKLLNIKNRCVHFDKSTITSAILESKTIPTNRTLLHAEPIHRYYQLCAIHRIPIVFKQHLQRFTELHYCSKCAILDKLLSAKHIKWWKQKSWNKNWKPGDVKLIVSPDYKTLQKWKGKKV